MSLHPRNLQSCVCRRVFIRACVPGTMPYVRVFTGSDASRKACGSRLACRHGLARRQGLWRQASRHTHVEIEDSDRDKKQDTRT